MPKTEPQVVMSADQFKAVMAAAVQEAVAAAMANLPAKKSNKPAKPAYVPPVRTPKPSTFKPQGSNGFWLCIPDGWEGIDGSNPPPTDAAIPVEVRGEAGPETRYYLAGRQGWKRNSKGTGWTSIYPSRIKDEEVAA